MRKSFYNFNFEEDWNFEANIEKRGVDSDLPDYHFRDDALLIWKAMKEYVDEMVKIFYESDQDVQDDFEIQAWFNEIIRYLLTSWKMVSKKFDNEGNILQSNILTSSQIRLLI